jgi:uncharacterized repeat protein (TIGR03803 family)
VKRIIGKSIILKWGQRACAAFTLSAATVIVLSAQTFTRLHSFDGADGKRPIAALIQTTNGDLYGTTNSGGLKPTGVGFGTAFAISPSGTFKTIHDFCSQTNSSDDCLDGASPTAPLLQAENGNLFGTTPSGGDNYNCIGPCGIVFKMTLTGAVTPLLPERHGKRQ